MPKNHRPSRVGGKSKMLITYTIGNISFINFLRFQFTRQSPLCLSQEKFWCQAESNCRTNRLCAGCLAGKGGRGNSLRFPLLPFVKNPDFPNVGRNGSTIRFCTASSAPVASDENFDHGLRGFTRIGLGTSALRRAVKRRLEGLVSIPRTSVRSRTSPQRSGWDYRPAVDGLVRSSSHHLAS